MLIIYVVPAMLVFGLCINIKVLYSIFKQSPNKRKRPASVLIAHLGCVAIFLTFLSAAKYADKTNLVVQRGHGVCETLSALRKITLGIFSTNVFAIVFERFHTFKYFKRSKLQLRQLFCHVWSVGVIFSFPSAFMVKYVESESSNTTSTSGTCEYTHLFSSAVATVIFETVYLVVFHLSLVFYMIYAMCKIKTSLKLLHLNQPIRNPKVKHKARKVRYIFLHFISFSFAWVPYGVLQLAGRMLRIQHGQDHNLVTSIEKVFGLILYIYMIFTSLIYLWLIPTKKSPTSFSDSRSPTTRQSGVQCQEHTSGFDNEDNGTIEGICLTEKNGNAVPGNIPRIVVSPPDCSTSKRVGFDLTTATSV